MVEHYARACLPYCVFLYFFLSFVFFFVIYFKTYKQNASKRIIINIIIICLLYFEIIIRNLKINYRKKIYIYI